MPSEPPSRPRRIFVRIAGIHSLATAVDYMLKCRCVHSLTCMCKSMIPPNISYIYTKVLIHLLMYCCTSLHIATTLLTAVVQPGCRPSTFCSNDDVIGFRLSRIETLCYHGTILRGVSAVRWPLLKEYVIAVYETSYYPAVLLYPDMLTREGEQTNCLL